MNIENLIELLDIMCSVWDKPKLGDKGVQSILKNNLVFLDEFRKCQAIIKGVAQ